LSKNVSIDPVKVCKFFLDIWGCQYLASASHHQVLKIPTFFPLKSTAIPLKICISGKTWFPNHGFALNIKMGHWCAKFWTPPQMGHVPFF